MFSLVNRRKQFIKDLYDQISKEYEQHAHNGATLWVNGQRIQIPNGSISAEETVIEFLRSRLGLTSCKLGCGEGGCGACTVTVSHYDDDEDRVIHRSVNGCLTPILSLHGAAITTAEGICSSTVLHPIQMVLSNTHGSQCGFCTPGIIMSVYSKWMEKSSVIVRKLSKLHYMETSSYSNIKAQQPSSHNCSVQCIQRLEPTDIEDALDGNLCRCTGYRPILQGFSSLINTSTSRGSLLSSDSKTSDLYTNVKESQLLICNDSASSTALVSEQDRSISTTSTIRSECNLALLVKNGSTKGSLSTFNISNDIEKQEECEISSELQQSIEWLIEHELEQEQMANRLKLLDTARMPLYFKTRHLGRVVTWITPASLKDLLTIVEHLILIGRRFKLLHGNTERHIDRVYKFTHTYPLTLISTAKILELVEFQWSSDGVRIGASYPINRISDQFKNKLDQSDRIDSEKNHHRILQAYIQQFRWFAGCQIRNVACLGGNIATASPISDLNPLHLAADVVLTIASLDVDEDKNHVSVKTREKRILDKFFQGYRKVDLMPNEIIVSVFIPLFTHSSNFHIFGFKQSRRREDDIAIVNSGVSVLFRNVPTNPIAPSQTSQIKQGGDTSKNLREQYSDSSIRTCEQVPIVDRLILAYGGMAPRTIVLSDFMKFWEGRPWTLETLVESLPILKRLTELPSNTPGGQVQYRVRLARNFFFKFFFQVAYECGLPFERLRGSLEFQFIPELLLPLLNQKRWDMGPAIYSIPSHPTYCYERKHSKGLQYYGKKRGDLNKCSAAGEANKHLAGDLHVTGKAIYLDDMQIEHDELHGVLLTSTQPYAKVVNIDLSECEHAIGFVDFIEWKDIQGKQKVGAIFEDEDVFVKTDVLSVGQPIGIVIAKSHEAARDATARIKVLYEKLSHDDGAILCIEDAIKCRSFHPLDFDGSKESKIEVLNRKTDGVKLALPQFKDFDHIWKHLGIETFKGPYPLINDVVTVMQPSVRRSKCGQYVIVSGGIKMGGQEHFYLEPQACRVVPSENDEMTVFSSTQDPAKTQAFVSYVTGIPKHKIVCKCKRMGGGFGGKETRASFFAAYAAVAAQKLRKPVRLVLDRDVDFQCSGQRHTFLSFYCVAMETSSKKIIAADLQLYNDAGWSTDLSGAVMERALFHCENSYYIPNVRTVGRCCKTNLPSNTAFRGFGGPQGMFLAETYIEHLAAVLACHPDIVRETNFYKTGDMTPYNYEIVDSHLHRMFKELKESSNYKIRQKEIEIFNKRNLWNKRGIRIIPVKFGIAFTKTFMNQAGSLVHVYTDGSVLVSHTGTEMGQGLHTKVAQVAATVFDLPIDSIYISETATDKVPNGMPTAASSGTDLNGMATLNACNTLVQRLQPYIQNERSARGLPLHITPHVDNAVRKEIFKSAAFAAHMERINLSANGFYGTPDIKYDFKTNTGKPFHYVVYAMACTEVEVDTLTGDHQVLRSDIIEDTGCSLNPAIDIGQIEGGFIQGMGLFTLEEIVTSPTGRMCTKGPAGYKIPAFGDIPIDFRVTLLEEAKNPAIPSIYSSKAVGEPPVFLASSVFFALRDAIESKRLDLLLSHSSTGSELQQLKELKPDESIFAVFNKNAGVRNESNTSLKRLWYSFNSPATSERICNACHRED